MNTPAQAGRSRPYDATRRREAAERSRAGVLDVAEQRFLGEGYARTTIAAIAADAGVSVDTVYKSFGGKPGLVRAIRERALQGSDEVPAEDRSDALQATHADPSEVIAGWGRLVAEVAPRVAPVLLLVRDAAVTDAEMQTLRGELDADRLRRMTTNARRLHRTGRLRAGVSVGRAADVLWTYSAPELYELLVVTRGWSAERYGTFVAEAITAALV